MNNLQSRPSSTAGVNFQLSCESEEGAALIVRGPTSHYHAQYPMMLEKYFCNHYRELLDWIREEYSEVINLEDIRLLLVTGVDLVTAWAMTIFHSQKKRCCFNVQGGGSSGGISNASLGGWLTLSDNTSAPPRQGPAYRPGGSLYKPLEELQHNGSKQYYGDDSRLEDVDMQSADDNEDVGAASPGVTYYENIETPTSIGVGSEHAGLLISQREKPNPKSGPETADREDAKPNTGKVAHGPRSTDINQCVFMQVYRFKRRKNFRWPGFKMNAEAEPKDPDLDDLDELDLIGPVGVGNESPDSEASSSSASESSDVGFDSQLYP